MASAENIRAGRTPKSHHQHFTNEETVTHRVLVTGPGHPFGNSRAELVSKNSRNVCSTNLHTESQIKVIGVVGGVRRRISFIHLQMRKPRPIKVKGASQGPTFTVY